MSYLEKGFNVASINTAFCSILTLVSVNKDREESHTLSAKARQGLWTRFSPLAALLPGERAPFCPLPFAKLYILIKIKYPAVSAYGLQEAVWANGSCRTVGVGV